MTNMHYIGENMWINILSTPYRAYLHQETFTRNSQIFPNDSFDNEEDCADKCSWSEFYPKKCNLHNFPQRDIPCSKHSTTIKDFTSIHYWDVSMCIAIFHPPCKAYIYLEIFTRFRRNFVTPVSKIMKIHRKIVLGRVLSKSILIYIVSLTMIFRVPSTLHAWRIWQTLLTELWACGLPMFHSPCMASSYLEIFTLISKLFPNTSFKNHEIITEKFSSCEFYQIEF